MDEQGALEPVVGELIVDPLPGEAAVVDHLLDEVVARLKRCLRAKCAGLRPLPPLET